MMKTLRLAFASLLAATLGFVLAPAVAAAAPLQTAVFSGGCFWCMEHDMKAIPGVVSVQSGYTGGHVDRPSYEQVVTETTGHYESEKVTYDPAKTSYPFILYRYWKLIDPTDGGGQFCDRGPSYRPAIFVADAGQRKAAEQSFADAQKKLGNKKIAVQILPLKTFWPAEDYHRNYAETNKAAYDRYRTGCGRDDTLRRVWGNS